MDVVYELLREEINNEKEEPKGDKWTFFETTFSFVVSTYKIFWGQVLTTHKYLLQKSFVLYG